MAEKYSRFRDPGTGIQVFLTPVSPTGASVLAGAAVPLLVMLGAVRVIVAAVAYALYLIGVPMMVRIVLAMLGFWSVTVETVSPTRTGRGIAAKDHSKPGKGEVVVCNHSSWIDLLLLHHLYPGLALVAPVVEDAAPMPAAAAGAQGRKSTPRKNAMSAHTTMVTPPSNSSSSTRSSEPRKVVGWTTLSLPNALSRTAHLPLTASQQPTADTLEKVLAKLSGPGLVFVEGTTSNNRALLALDPEFIPYNIPTHIVSIKYTSATAALLPTSTTSVPSNVAKHALSLMLFSWPLRRVQIRALATPTTPTTVEDVASALSTLARLKKTSLGWQDKADFLNMISRQA